MGKAILRRRVEKLPPAIDNKLRQLLSMRVVHHRRAVRSAATATRIPAVGHRRQCRSSTAAAVPAG